VLYARIALGFYILGLVVTVVFNVFNRRIGYDQLSLAKKNAWAGLLYLRGLLLYPSIAVLTYYSVQWSGLVLGILAGIGALIFKSMVNRLTWRMFN
jgi:hypothetical protein